MHKNTTATGTCDIDDPLSDDCDYFEITPTPLRANCFSGNRPLHYFIMSLISIILHQSEKRELLLLLYSGS